MILWFIILEGLKRRFYNQFKADSSTKLHVFLKLVGWEHFNIYILEIRSSETQGARENYYLQKYLPLLNSTFSSSLTESAINVTLKSKLNALRTTKSISSSVSKSVPIYVYDIYDKGINKTYVKFNSMRDASRILDINKGSMYQYRNTNVPFRDKLFYTQPIINFDLAFESSKQNTPSGLINRVISIKLWVYDAKTLELIKGNPFLFKISSI